MADLVSSRERYSRTGHIVHAPDALFDAKSYRHVAASTSSIRRARLHRQLLFVSCLHHCPLNSWGSKKFHL
jgi:hypothetical protein